MLLPKFLKQESKTPNNLSQNKANTQKSTRETKWFVGQNTGRINMKLDMIVSLLFSLVHISTSVISLDLISKP